MRARSRNEVPALTAEQIESVPELTILAALEATLALALTHLLVVHPKLRDEDCPPWARDHSPQFEAAQKLYDRAHTCLEAIRRYRRLHPPPPPPPANERDF